MVQPDTDWVDLALSAGIVVLMFLVGWAAAVFLGSSADSNDDESDCD